MRMSRFSFVAMALLALVLAAQVRAEELECVARLVENNFADCPCRS